MKKIKLSAVLSVLFLIFAFNSSCQQPEKYAKTISADSLNLLLSGKHGVLLDVRTPGEFKKGHIEGAINIDFLDDSFASRIDSLDKNVQYEVYCHSGGRSTEATELMKTKGFNKLLNFDGGYSKWVAKGLPVTK